MSSTPSPAPSSQAPPSGAAGSLVLAPNIADPDGFYDELLQAHDGLEPHESDALDARLILILCNHIGDRDVIREALAVARGRGGGSAPGGGTRT